MVSKKNKHVTEAEPTYNIVLKDIDNNPLVYKAYTESVRGRNVWEDDFIHNTYAKAELTESQLLEFTNNNFSVLVEGIKAKGYKVIKEY